jgi:oligoendopeptidase F
MVGIDLSDPGFWSNGLNLIEAQLDAAESAANTVQAEKSSK